MHRTTKRLWAAASAVIGCLAAAACEAPQEELISFVGVDECVRPPVEHCPDENCPVETVVSQGPVTDAATGRHYFLDYSCDLKKDEPVNLVLSLHGGGSYGNWQRHYFPLLDYVDEYDLVVATPNAPPQFWAPSDDEYLEGLVDSLVDQIGPKNIRSFWMVGHSQGGMTSNRLVCSDYFADKVDGWLSLSGGRIGPAQLAAGFGVPGRTEENSTSGDDAQEEGAGGDAPAGMPANAFPPIEGVNGPERARPGAAVTPTCDIHYIFTTGDLEVAGVPDTSPWADKYDCTGRAREEDIVDTKAGYVSSRQTAGQEPNPAWGREPRPGTAEVYEYTDCKSEKLVADVIRLDKGHTEGLEPEVTRKLIEMMVSAPGGKLSGSNN